MKVSDIIILLSPAPALLAALPFKGSTSTCTNYVAGLTAWSDANFTGKSHQYNISSNTCGKKSHHPALKIRMRTKVLNPWSAVSMAAQFPYAQSAGVSSVIANPLNWCTLYP